ncbi:hypothetical protein pb186bvf_010555 [Paramecium bursaria]
MSVLLSEIANNVKLGKGCVISINCQIISDVGEIQIGDYTIIEDGCVIRNNQLKKMIIGSYNVFETQCKIENSNIGDGNVFEVRTQIESGCIIYGNCRFGIQTRVPPQQEIPDFSRVSYPFNIIKIQEYDWKFHREELQELFLHYQSLYEKSKQK